jgi:hypothetical protein
LVCPASPHRVSNCRGIVGLGAWQSLFCFSPAAVEIALRRGMRDVFLAFAWEGRGRPAKSGLSVSGAVLVSVAGLSRLGESYANCLDRRIGTRRCGGKDTVTTRCPRGLRPVGASTKTSRLPPVWPALGAKASGARPTGPGPESTEGGSYN